MLMNQIKPFDEFWYNCYINNIISILRSQNNSYHNLMYINDYQYSIHTFENNADAYFAIDFLTSKRTAGYLNNLSMKERYYKNKKIFMEEINDKVMAGMLIAPKVDLFFWNKTGIGYKTWKSYHYSLLIGFNSSNSEYQALEDDKNSNFVKISEKKEDLEKAILSVQEWAGNGADYVEISINNEMQDYYFKVEDLIVNIELTCTSIADVLKADFFAFTKNLDQIPECTEFQAISIAKVITKMKVNRILLQKLLDHKIITRSMFEKNDLIFEELCKSYTIIRNVLLKSKFISVMEFRDKKSLKLNIRIKDNLTKEYCLWNELKDEILKLNGTEDRMIF